MAIAKEEATRASADSVKLCEDLASAEKKVTSGTFGDYHCWCRSPLREISAGRKKRYSTKRNESGTCAVLYGYAETRMAVYETRVFAITVSSVRARNV